MKRLVGTAMVSLAVASVGVASQNAIPSASEHPAQEYAICAGRLWPVGRPSFGPGCLHIRAGRIVSVGPRDTLPEGVPVIDRPTGTLIPGLVDIHSHLGLRGDARQSGELNERSERFSPQLRALDGFDPFDPALAHARSGGVTTLLISSGSIAIVSGQSALIKLKDAPLDQMLVRAPAGVKATSWHPDTFEQLDKWLEGARTSNASQDEPETRIANRLLQREIPLIVHGAYPSGEIEPILDVVDKYRLRLIVYHCETCDQNYEEFLSRGIPIVLGPRILYWHRGRSTNLASFLARKGASIAISTDASDAQQKYLMEQAGLALHYGLSMDDALRSITLSPAEMIGIDHRVGSLEPGKDADVVLLSGPLFGATTRVTRVIIDGASVYESER